MSWQAFRGGHQGSGAGSLALQREAVGRGLVQAGEGAPNSIPSTGGRGWRRRSQALHRAAWWEGERQRHKLKHEHLRLEIRRSLFPEDSPAVEQGLREVGLFPSLGVSHPGWLKLSAAWSEPTTEPAQGRGWGWRHSQVPSSLNCPVVLYLPTVSASGLNTACVLLINNVYNRYSFQNSTRNQVSSYPSTIL